jgi:putative transposase
VSFESNRNVVYFYKYHVVFCPKYRRKVLLPRIDGRLKEIMRETCMDARSELIDIEVMPDHVHKTALFPSLYKTALFPSAC